MGYSDVHPRPWIPNFNGLCDSRIYFRTEYTGPHRHFGPLVRPAGISNSRWEITEIVVNDKTGIGFISMPKAEVAIMIHRPPFIRARSFHLCSLVEIDSLDENGSLGAVEADHMLFCMLYTEAS